MTIAGQLNCTSKKKGGGMFDFATTVLHTFLGALGSENISIAISIFARLLSIEVGLFGIAMALGKVECSDIFYKSLMIAFYLYFIQNYQVITGAMFDFFSNTGIQLGGSGLGLSADFLMDPSSIMNTGWKTVIKIWVLDSGFDLLLRQIDNIFRLINSIIVLIAFFIIMACSIFRVLEFYLVTTMSLILFPFGIIGFLSYLSENCIGNLFKLGMKLMTFTFITSLSLEIFDDHIVSTLSSNPSLKESISCSVASCIICLLIWKVPEVAAGLITGNPSLRAFGAVKAGANLVKNIATKGANSISKALKK
jgi:type IV secretion system protein TrbL